MTRRLDARHRAEQAARMLGTGATWQEVADALGYRSRQAAQQAVSRLLDRTPAESVEQARRRQAYRVPGNDRGIELECWWWRSEG